jgi:CheY-like chemotaxis protein
VSTVGDPSSSDKMRAACAEPPTTHTSDVPRSGDLPTAKLRVLIVEDEVALGRALVRFLRGYTVTFCVSMDEALDRVRGGECFDAIVSDMMMPGGNGDELHAVLAREAPEMAERMLFMTGGATTPEARAFVAAHAARVVTKPLDLATLRARVDAIVNARGVLDRDVLDRE